jgi:membrane fusion protein (multidrug efflux system)
MLKETVLPGDEEKLKPNLVALTAPIRSPQRRRFVVLGGLAAAVLIAVSASYYAYASRYESTDDAFIEGHVVAVSPKVASYVSEVLIDDNAHVEAGDLLVELDARDFETQLAHARANLQAVAAQHQSATINMRVVDTTSNAGVKQAEAEVETAQRQVDGGRSQLQQAKDQVAAAQSPATRARDDEIRSAELFHRELIARQEFDHAAAVAQNTAAQLAAARATEQAISAALSQAESQLEEAKARLASAQAVPDQVAYSRARAEQVQAQVTQLEAACTRRSLICRTQRSTRRSPDGLHAKA